MRAFSPPKTIIRQFGVNYSMRMYNAKRHQRELQNVAKKAYEKAWKTYLRMAAPIVHSNEILSRKEVVWLAKYNKARPEKKVTAKDLEHFFEWRVRYDVKTPIRNLPALRNLERILGGRFSIEVFDFGVKKLLQTRPKITPKEIVTITRILKQANPASARFILELGFAELFKVKPDISTKDLAKYGTRFVEFSRTGFDAERIMTFIKSLKTKKPAKRILYGEKRTRSSHASTLYLDNGNAVRYLPAARVKAWKKLAAAGVAVEEIVKEEKRYPTKLRDVDLMVTSKPAGQTLYTILLTLTKSQSSSVFRQCLKIMRNTWIQGVQHGHMHLGNFSVEFKRGVPKVRLIDFSQAVDHGKKVDLRQLTVIKGNNKKSALTFAIGTLHNIAFKMEKKYTLDQLKKMLLKGIF